MKKMLKLFPLLLLLCGCSGDSFTSFWAKNRKPVDVSGYVALCENTGISEKKLKALLKKEIDSFEQMVLLLILNAGMSEQDLKEAELFKNFVIRLEQDYKCLLSVSPNALPS